MNLFITVEITSRELEAKSFLACCAAKAGFNVYIGQEDMIRRLAVLKGPGVLLDKSIHSEYPPLFVFLKRLGFHIAVNDEEGLVFNPKQYGAFNLTPEVTKGLDIFFAWGDLQRKLFAKHLPVLADSVFSTGNPRMDLLQPILRPFHEDKVRAIQKRYGHFTLINSRFAFANNAIGGPAYRSRLAAGKNGPNIEYLLARYDFDEKLFNAFMEMQKQLCHRFPEKTFVLRPHPAESMAPWEELAKDYSNLHITREGNVHQWILASDMLIHNGCATAIEAFYLDTPSVCYRPIVSDIADIVLPNSVSFNIFDMESLFQCVEGKMDQTIKEQRKRWAEILAPYLHSNPNRLAAPAMVEKLLELAARPRDIKIAFTLYAKVNGWIRHWNRMLKMRINALRGKKKNGNIKWVPYTTEGYRTLIKKFACYDPEFAEMEVTSAYNNCFLIRKKADR